MKQQPAVRYISCTQIGVSIQNYIYIHSEIIINIGNNTYYKHIIQVSTLTTSDRLTVLQSPQSCIKELSLSVTKLRFVGRHMVANGRLMISKSGQ
jgi:hypothetical protein